MKIRQGFVSNSSSSSFCIFGIALDLDSSFPSKIQEDILAELDKYSIEKYEVSFKELFEDDDGCAIELAVEKTGLWSNYNSDFGTIWIGREYSSIKDDETGREFKDRVLLDLGKVFTDDAIESNRGTYEESWYNG